jgi:hypothetical protein
VKHLPLLIALAVAPFAVAFFAGVFVGAFCAARSRRHDLALMRQAQADLAEPVLTATPFDTIGTVLDEVQGDWRPEFSRN